MMRRTVFAASVLPLFFASLALATEVPLSEAVPHAESLTLAQAIERAMTHNPDLVEGELTLRQGEISFQDSWATMYLPTVNLGTSTTSTKTMGTLPGNNTDTAPSHGYPVSTAYLTLGEYTLYNFGRDKISYDQAKINWTRTKEGFEENKRAIKFKVINAFWALKSAIDALDAYERSVEIAEAILHLQESRVLVGKATQADVSSSNVDLLDTKNQRDSQKGAVNDAILGLNVLLGDPAGAQYRLEGEIGFLPIKVTEEVLYETYLRESPTMKQARANIENAHLSLILTEKNYMPLPTIKFSGVSLYYGNSYYGTGNSYYSNSSGNNLNIAASVSLSIPILGPHGFFGQRSVESSQLSLDSEELKLKHSANRDRETILQYVQRIRQYEGAVTNSRESYKSSMQVLQSVMDDFASKRPISRLEIRDAINHSLQSEVSLNGDLNNHLSQKTQLAAFIGVDYLPRVP